MLLLDMAFNWRWKLHDLLAGDAAAHDLYSGRRPYQVAVLGILAVLLLVGAVVAVVRLGRRGGGVALAGMLFSIGMWSTEVVSYHNVDRILNHQIGDVLVICFFWILVSCMTTLGIAMTGKN